MVGWHHQLNGHEDEKILGDGEGQGSLACCHPWGHKESTILLNNNIEKNLCVSRPVLFRLNCDFCPQHNYRKVDPVGSLS